MTTARAVLFAGGDQLLDHLGHGGAADDRTEVLRVLGGHGGERFGASQFACPEVVFHRGDERQPGFVREVACGDEGVPLMRLREPDEEPGPAADESVRVRKKVAARKVPGGIPCGRRPFFHGTSLFLSRRSPTFSIVSPRRVKK